MATGIARHVPQPWQTSPLPSQNLGDVASLVPVMQGGRRFVNYIVIARKASYCPHNFCFLLVESGTHHRLVGFHVKPAIGPGIGTTLCSWDPDPALCLQGGVQISAGVTGDCTGQSLALIFLQTRQTARDQQPESSRARAQRHARYAEQREREVFAALADSEEDSGSDLEAESEAEEEAWESSDSDVLIAELADRIARWSDLESDAASYPKSQRPHTSLASLLSRVWDCPIDYKNISQLCKCRSSQSEMSTSFCHPRSCKPHGQTGSHHCTPHTFSERHATCAAGLGNPRDHKGDSANSLRDQDLHPAGDSKHLRLLLLLCATSGRCLLAEQGQPAIPGEEGTHKRSFRLWS